jgi:MFS family permease
MKKTYQIALFTGSLVGWTIGNGLLPVLPVYAAELDISPTQTGIYLAFGYVALIIGIIVAGFVSDRWQKRQRLLLVVGFAGVPAIWLMGLVTQYWTLVLVTCVVWFLGGMGIALFSILAGLLANPEERGAIFSLLALTSALGALVGGATIGPIADRWGFATMFAALAAFALLSPMATSLLPEKRISLSPEQEKADTSRLPAAFVILMLAVFIGSNARFIGQLVTSLVMNEQMFSTAAISGVTAVGGAGAIPLIGMMGWLSDRYSRKHLLATCYATGIIGFVILAGSVQLWHYWLSAVFLAVLGYGAAGVGSALVSDIVPAVAIGRALALFRGLTLAGGIVGFAATGYILQQLGAGAIFAIGTLFSLLAGLILFAVHPPQA